MVRTFPILMAATVITVAVSACTGEEREPEPVDFSKVDSQQVAAERGFLLHVSVVGVENGTRAIPGAFVGAAEGREAVAKNYADADGKADLVLRKDQTIRIVAQAEGWTTEDSGVISIGSTNRSGSTGSCVVGPCFVVDSDETPTFELDGEEGFVTMTLFRKRLEQSLAVTASPNANPRVVSAPEQKLWFAKSERLEKESVFHRLYMVRLDRVDAQLTWTNSITAQGDFELGLGCTDKQPDKTTDGGMAQSYLSKQGEVKVTVENWEPFADEYWSKCRDIYAGPLTDSVNSDVATKVALTLSFEGKTRILPVGV